MSEQKYLDILSQLTLDEKLSLLSGKTYWLTQEIDRLGVPSVWMSDGPHGMRKEKQTGGTNIMQASETSTCFPTAVTTASSWDTDLLEEVGNTIADEAKALKVTTILGPGVNIKRSPLCGRNFEYISEDPFRHPVTNKTLRITKEAPFQEETLITSPKIPPSHHASAPLTFTVYRKTVLESASSTTVQITRSISVCPLTPWLTTEL